MTVGGDEAITSGGPAGTEQTAVPGGSEGATFGPDLFGPDFLWGAATSAFQVEGSLAADGRGESVWDVFARRPGLRDLLIRLARDYPQMPLMITENGGVFGDGPTHDGQVHDRRRIRFIRQHVTVMAEAMAAGTDVRGYFHWARLDNFEWAMGYRPRFGLTYVEYPTGRRIIKDSGRYYAELARTSRLPDVPPIQPYG